MQLKVVPSPTQSTMIKRNSQTRRFSDLFSALKAKGLLYNVVELIVWLVQQILDNSYLEITSLFLRMLSCRLI